MSYARALVYTAIAAFVVSLFLPSVNAMWGTMTVFFGVASLLFDPPWFIVWLANPLFILGAWLILKERAPVWRRIVPVLALVCAVYGLMAESWVTADTGLPQVMTIHVGYWVWLGSMALLTLAAFSPNEVHAVDPAGESHPA